jgi:PhzF family phenazine biosynthesis protein
MKVPMYQVDAFTAEPFAGNPAAVCLLDRPAGAAWMQAVAAEMNLAETAFVVPTGDRFGLRWFTPAVEVDLCGHATLAAAHVIWSTPLLGAGQPCRFDTRSGELACHRRDDGWIEMDFPATPAEPATAPPGLFDALGVAPAPVWRSRFDYLVELPSAGAVRSLSPDFRRLATIDTRGVIVTAPGDDSDFVSRFFAPAVGIDEDPVTGSAHCCLAVHWAGRLNRTGELVGRQLSRRGGVVRCALDGDRVRLAGQAVTVLRGELTVPAA